MLLFFLIYGLYARASPFPVSMPDQGNPASLTCQDINNCRKLWSIMWSCFSTIILCTWIAVHPNIPEPIDAQHMGFLKRRWYTLKNFVSERILLFIVALLVPEYILAWAIRQRLAAGAVVKRGGDERLTMAHGFFIIMGGFHYYECAHEFICPHTDSTSRLIRTSTFDLNADYDEQGSWTPSSQGGIPEDNESLVRYVKTKKLQSRPAHPLGRWAVLSLIQRDVIQVPTEDEILDKSKSDTLAKFILLIQLVWFGIQFGARSVAGLPVAELEIVTLAYAVINLGIFAAWWDKPRNVKIPIQVLVRDSYGSRQPTVDDPLKNTTMWKFILSIMGIQDKDISLEDLRKVPTFYSGVPEEKQINISDIITLAIGILFGAIHCLAWNLTFPSHMQLVLWRLSAVAMVGVPFVISAAWGVCKYLSYKRWMDSLDEWALAVLLLPLGLMYIAARITSIVLAFMTLQCLPPGAYVAIRWTTLIPHI